MLHQNISSVLGSSFDQPKNLFSLSSCFEKLEITKSLDKKRDEYLKTIRSQKRKLRLHSKRLGAFSLHSLSNQLDNIQIQEDTFGEGLNITNYINECLRRPYNMEEYDEILRCLYSCNRFKQHFGVIGLRKILAADCPPIQQVIDAGVIPRLIEFMERIDEPQLQLESTWAMSNLASGTTEQTRQVIDHGAIPVLIRLLRSSYAVRAQAVWALGNIAGDNSEYRDVILSVGGLGPMIRVVEKAINKGRADLIKQGTWVLTNLCRGAPLPQYDSVKDAVGVLARVVMTQSDVEILCDALWPLHYLSQGTCEQIQRVLATGVVLSVVRILEENDSVAILLPGIKLLGNMFTGTEAQANAVLQVRGVVEILFELLKRPEEAIRKEICWILSNIAAGTSDHIEFILSNSNHLDQIFDLCLNDSLAVRKEIAWMLSNAIKNGNQGQLEILFSRGIIDHLGKFLQEEGDVCMQELGLRGIVGILYLEEERAPEGFSKGDLRRVLEENNMMRMIEGLQDHMNPVIVGLVHKILDAFSQGESAFENEFSFSS